MSRGRQPIKERNENITFLDIKVPNSTINNIELTEELQIPEEFSNREEFAKKYTRKRRKIVKTYSPIKRCLT